ncbi:hypothetical protein J7443_24725, partial [Tropicibacter sp. R15_0]|uniref:hypothetical protein n=1 Tax=Tropicibacter sp. R15_0 TaxID=2821101 RepID=UPI001ADAE327
FAPDPAPPQGGREFVSTFQQDAPISDTIARLPGLDAPTLGAGREPAWLIIIYVADFGSG